MPGGIRLQGSLLFLYGKFDSIIANVARIRISTCKSMNEQVLFSTNELMNWSSIAHILTGSDVYPVKDIDSFFHFVRRAECGLKGLAIGSILPSVSQSLRLSTYLCLDTGMPAQCLLTSLPD